MATRISYPVIVAGLLLVSAASQAVPPSYTFQTGIGTDDISGSTDSFYYVTGSGQFFKALSRNSITHFLGEITTQEYQDDSDRSGEEIFLQAKYSYTPRAGFSVPTYSAAIRYEQEFLDDSDLEASTATLILSAFIRIDDQTDLRGGLKLGDSSSEAHDVSSTGLFISADFRLSPRWIAYGTLDIEEEDIDFENSNTTIPGRSKSAAKSIAARTHLPGQSNSTSTSTSSTSDNTFYTIGANYAINSSNTIDMSISRREYDTSTGETVGNEFALDYFYRF